MELIQVNLAANPYPVYAGTDILDKLAEVLKQHGDFNQIAVITSKSIFQMHGKKLMQGFTPDQEVITLFVPDGEGAKSFDQLQHLYSQLLEKKFERKALIIAFGGGVIGDLAGFAAATYLRGIALVQVPTTLLSQVDSSIGGKVGINHPLGKNLIGAFKQPLFVFSDIAVLKTLPASEIRCGLGEVIKYGMILDGEFFEYLERNLEMALNKEDQILLHLVKTSAALKARVVEQDEKEYGIRMILNYGHTFGHALEAEFKFGELKHGEAVILGMKCALQYSLDTKALSQAENERCLSLLNRVPINYDKTKIYSKRLIERMSRDKKVRDKQIKLILTDRIGHYYTEIAENQDQLRDAYRILE
ncbi:MAG: 3-dehydroquinate synthase [Calditrichaceae bacterium]